VQGAADLAKGNRFFAQRSWRGMPRNRIFGNVVLSFLTRIATGYWHVLDAQNGYTAISRHMLSRLPLDALETGYEFENRMLIELRLLGARVREVPIPARYGEETSGIRVVRDGLAIVRALFTGFWRRTAAEHLRRGPSAPGVALIGSVLTLAAASVGLVAAMLGVDAPWVGSAVGGGFLIGLAGMTVFFALDARRNRRRVGPSAQPLFRSPGGSGREQRPQHQHELRRGEQSQAPQHRA
jgi:hypothetical protein